MSRFYPFPQYPVRPDKYGRTRIKIKGKHFSLGKHGTPESLQEYARLAAEHAQGVPLKPKLPTTAGCTVDALIALWAMEQDRLASSHGGNWRHEAKQIKRALIPLSRLFGDTKADEFSARRLKALQEAMVARSWQTPEELGETPWSRNYCRMQIKRVVRLFRWAEAEGAVPRGTTEHLKTTQPIPHDDTRVRESVPKSCVEWGSQVEPVLKLVSKQVAAVTRLQYLAGMRPGEIVIARPCDINPDGPDGCWLYAPSHHKGDWRDGSAAVLIKILSPQAIEVLKPWLLMAESDESFLFPPHKRNEGQHLTVESYSRAIATAVAKAKVKKWTPADLRHTAAEIARRLAGDQGVKALLGHESLQTGKHYAKRPDLILAAQVAKQLTMAG